MVINPRCCQSIGTHCQQQHTGHHLLCPAKPISGRNGLRLVLINSHSFPTVVAKYCAKYPSIAFLCRWHKTYPVHCREYSKQLPEQCVGEEIYPPTGDSRLRNVPKVLLWILFADNIGHVHCQFPECTVHGLRKKKNGVKPKPYLFFRLRLFKIKAAGSCIDKNAKILEAFTAMHYCVVGTERGKVRGPTCSRYSNQSIDCAAPHSFVGCMLFLRGACGAVSSSA